MGKEGIMKILHKMIALIWLIIFYLRQLPELIYGVWKIFNLPQPVISIFGGHNITNQSQYAKWAKQLSERIVAHGISILTGGGPGIMEAANCGAFRENYQNVHTMGIGVRGLLEEHVINPCVKELIMTNYFPLRKFLLIQYSVVYVIFPGAFGTLNEITEVITLMHTRKLEVRPIILIGKEFWQPLAIWMQQTIQDNLMHDEHPEYITFTDDLDEALSVIIAYCEKCKVSKK